jgi:transcriptional regulator with XRE-family HTH domain
MASRRRLAVIFGSRAKEVRESRGLTIETTARAAGLGIGALSEIERAKRWRTRFDQIERLAEALGVPVADLLGRQEKPRRAATG